ncbi:ankyrin repeat domain protein [Stylonychia lemnae]|uniref:Ankyrin repeat domain protein n=1 Tax=Stylonychia lemnae TaxID=5949 RepID=A0A077ZPN4_STYLE|nr:ankyrin repeat domain protein [Stylonychia lemnae]|eukprot:CDW71927.1 ankyrin repeat domain protein [Stylonychia lemnae]
MGCCQTKKQAKNQNIKEGNDQVKSLDDYDSLHQDDPDKRGRRRTFQEQKESKLSVDTPNDQQHELSNSRATKGERPLKKQQRKSTRVKEGADLLDELKKAVYNNDEELLNELLEIDPELCNMMVHEDKKVHIIHIASKQSDNDKIVRTLIDKGADIDCTDVKNWTPLMIAAMNANIAVVKLLVALGCNLSMESSDGKTAREFAEETLLEEQERKNQDIKTKKKIADLHKIMSLLPDEQKVDDDHVTPNNPNSRPSSVYKMNKI